MGEDGKKVVATNRKARHEYEILDTYEAGLVLKGPEVKSLREGKVGFQDAYARLEGGEVWLHSLHISPYEQANRFNEDPLRPRKLLLNRHEIRRLVGHVEEKGLTLHRYWTNVCGQCSIKDRCTPGKERRVTRWEHEHVLDEVQRRLDENPQAMRQRRETVEHPFGTIKDRMGATHFLMKTLPNVATEMALHVLGYNLTRVMNILGTASLIKAMQA